MDLLECPVCLSTFDEPQLLPACGHTFCRACLEGVVRGASHFSPARCPTCRRPFRAADPRPNFALRQLLSAGGGAARTEEEVRADGPGGSCARRLSAPSAAGQIKRLVFAGAPYGLAKLMAEEDAQIGLRIFVLDNSGSTSAYDGHYFKKEGEQVRAVNCTRWEEIKAMALEHAEWNAAFGVPCEFILLNGQGQAAPRQEGRDFMRLDPSRTDSTTAQQVAALKRMLDASGPRGPTPLAQRVMEVHQRIRRDLAQLTENGQKVVLVLVTDGLPTDPYGHGESRTAQDSLGRCLKRLCMELPVYVVLRLVTDDDGILDYYSEMDRELELNLEVLDDLASEAREISKQGNGWLTYSPLLHRIREGGTFMKLFDLLDERRFTPVEVSVMVQLMVRQEGEPPFPTDPEGFMQVLEQRVPQEPPVYHPIRRRMEPMIDVNLVRWQILPLSENMWRAARGCAQVVCAPLRGCMHLPRPFTRIGDDGARGSHVNVDSGTDSDAGSEGSETRDTEPL